ncbi:dethiobiotin synthase [Hydrogenimonas thermophila]|uniref:dethiobiotin synthase n=1 Tax=Hydrogenimonas thermophila TaxID=223786 RepID=UPI0029372A9B|nr:dethiobiotin synthase [Hydrogenimonas thermophila]WOE70372.1 dethiobiotin synthase [Hydrogenimonas thermophila]WOE72887.1 dethiobiotin synthase [Hydrogenimonas thermophila]
MTIKIFVTATNTNIGKTYTTVALMQEAAKQGLRPAGFKPIETGVLNGKPADGTILLKTMQELNPSANELTIDDVVPIQFELPAAPYVAKGNKTISFDLIKEKLKKIEKVCDILFIEGAGGLLVPIEDNLFMIDLPAIFKVDRTLLISPSRLGSINDTLLSMEALTRREINFDLAINLYEDYESFEEVTLPYYKKAGESFYLLPRDLSKLISTFSNLHLQ